MKLSSLLRTWNLNKAGNKQAAALVTINLEKETFYELANSRTDQQAGSRVEKGTITATQYSQP